MRKMNKIVALSLVLAMALSMMASAASFKDQATINADLVSDINMMVALNVFSEDGTGAGYFEPNVELTRAQVAKMVYVLKNKGVDNGATSWTGMNIFSDVEAGAWYEGYVNYCASVGMIAGTGNGMFNPNGKVTAVEFAKLLLVLNGYKADVEGYTGDKWFENIVADAENAGIFADYELPVKGTVTREWAAKLLNNAINVTMVKYSDGQAVEQFVTTLDGNETVSFPITFKGQQLGLKEYTGILVETPNVKIGTTAENNTDGKNVYSVIELANQTSLKFKFDANPELLGQKVVVTVKGGLATSVNNADVKVYGVVAHEDVNVVETTINGISLTAIKDEPNNRIVKINGVEKKYDVTATANLVTVYTDYAPARAAVAITDANLFGTGIGAGAKDNREVKLIDNNNDGIYEVAFVDYVNYAKVNYIKAANNSFKVVALDGMTVLSAAQNWTTAAAYENINFVDTVAKDDIVKITKDYTSGEEIYNVELADVVTGVVSVVTSSGATIDGTVYGKHPAKSAALAVNSEAYDYFTDGKFIIFSQAPAASTADQENIAYVIKVGTYAGTWSDSTPVKKVDILKNDGTRETLSYVADNKYTNQVNWSNVNANTIYEYVMKDGKVYLKNLATVAGGDVKVAATAGNVTFDKSEKELTDGTSKWLINDNTYFFVKSVEDGSSKYAVVKGTELKGDITNNVYINALGEADNAEKIAVTANGLPYVVYGVLELTSEAPVAEGSANVIGIAASSQGTKLGEDNETIFTLNVTKLDGTVVTLESETTFDSAEVEGVEFANKFVKYTIGSNGFVSNFSVENAAGHRYGALEAVEGTKVVIDGTIYDLAEDVKVYFVDSYDNSSDGKAKTSVVTGEELSLETSIALEKDDNETNAFMYNANNNYKNAFFKVESNEITSIIVEIDGEFLYTNNYVGNVY